MTPSINTAIVCLGSNTPDRLSRLRRAIDDLAAAGAVKAFSDIYDNPADQGHGAPYLNAVGCIETTLSEEELAAVAAQLERRAGRTSSSKALGVMPLDIDIVLFNGRVCRPYDYTRPYFTTGYAQIAVTV